VLAFAENAAMVQTLALLVLASFMPAPTAIADANPGAQTEITTIADWSCDEWTRRRALKERTDPPQMWLVGYLTGMSSALRIDALAISSADDAFDWMDTWCLAHPAEFSSRGGHMYFKTLLDRLPRGPGISL
jgi:hypothetical protein